MSLQNSRNIQQIDDKFREKYLKVGKKTQELFALTVSIKFSKI